MSSFKIRDKHFAKNDLKTQKIAVITGGELDKKALFLSKDEIGKQSIALKGRSTFQPVPLFKKNMNERLYVAGPSGSGKSTYVSNWIAQFLKSRGKKDTDIYIFSSVEEDEALDGRFPDNIIRPDIDDNDIFNDPLHPSDFQIDSIVLFDDCAKIKNAKVRVALYMLQQNLLETARHYGITVIITSHMLSDYARTRTVLNESTSITVFPKFAGTSKHIRYYLDKTMGFDKSEIKKFLALSKASRWVTLNKGEGIYVMSSRQCYIYDDPWFSTAENEDQLKV